MQRESAIGIFDSGVGGLTVAKAFREHLPKENIYYFGDTAHVPYGTKSAETVKAYALDIAKFLASKDIKMLVVACNTVSAYAIKELHNLMDDIVVLDVISAGVEHLYQLKEDEDAVGVIGTLGTVNSGEYSKRIHAKLPEIEVISRACPLLVPLAEEGWIHHPATDATITDYLHDYQTNPVSHLILGCTHYPLFKEVIEAHLKPVGTAVIDSAEAIALQAKSFLEEKELNRLSETKDGKIHCYVSDLPQRFEILVQRFLGEKPHLVVQHRL